MVSVGVTWGCGYLEVVKCSSDRLTEGGGGWESRRGAVVVVFFSFLFSLLFSFFRIHFCIRSSCFHSAGGDLRTRESAGEGKGREEGRREEKKKVCWVLKGGDGGVWRGRGGGGRLGRSRSFVQKNKEVTKIVSSHIQTVPAPLPAPPPRPRLYLTTHQKSVFSLRPRGGGTS